MSNFIYVFNDSERDKLLALKYKIVKCDEENHVYVFLNKERLDFTNDDIKYVLSNTLTF